MCQNADRVSTVTRSRPPVWTRRVRTDARLWLWCRHRGMRKKSTMRSSVGRILLMVSGGLAVVAISFVATMRFMDFLLRPSDPNASVIRVVEATYGQSCKDFTPPPGHTNRFKVGNATAALTKACDTAKASCIFDVDVKELGDPVTGCGKDFIASWRCGSDPQVHQVFLPPEASGRSALLSCPAP